MRGSRGSRYLLFLIIAVLLFAIGIKVHSFLTPLRVSDWNYHQLQEFDHSKTSFSFVVLGDNKNSVNVFDNLISKLNKEDILFAIDNGDLVYDGDLEKFKFFLDQVKRLKKPFLTVFGNHDAREGGRAVYYELFGLFYYSFAVGHSYFIVLDDADEENLDDAQFAWLKKERGI